MKAKTLIQQLQQLDPEIEVTLHRWIGKNDCTSSFWSVAHYVQAHNPDLVYLVAQELYYTEDHGK